MNKRDQSAIKRVVLTAEKKLGIVKYYYVHNAMSADALFKIYALLEGKVHIGQRFKVMLKAIFEGDFRSGAELHYIVTEHKTGTKYNVTHYCPNKQFDNTFGWHIKMEENECQ